MRISDWSSDVCSSDLGRDQAGDDVEAGGLAGAVGAEQADRLAASDMHRDVAQHRPLLEALADVAGAQAVRSGTLGGADQTRAPALRCRLVVLATGHALRAPFRSGRAALTAAPLRA